MFEPHLSATFFCYWRNEFVDFFHQNCAVLLVEEIGGLPLLCCLRSSLILSAIYTPLEGYKFDLKGLWQCLSCCLDGRLPSSCSSVLWQ